MRTCIHELASEARAKKKVGRASAPSRARHTEFCFTFEQPPNRTTPEQIFLVLDHERARLESSILEHEIFSVAPRHNSLVISPLRR